MKPAQDFLQNDEKLLRKRKSTGSDWLKKSFMKILVEPKNFDYNTKERVNNFDKNIEDSSNKIEPDGDYEVKWILF